MSSRFWSFCSAFWTLVTIVACSSAETSYRVADFAAARARGCQQRMRAAIGLPPLP